MLAVLAHLEPAVQFCQRHFRAQQGLAVDRAGAQEVVQGHREQG